MIRETPAVMKIGRIKPPQMTIAGWANFVITPKKIIGISTIQVRVLTFIQFPNNL